MKKIVIGLLALAACSSVWAKECTILELGEVDANRLHILCKETFPDGSDNIRFFAFPTNSSSEQERERANRIWSVALAAIASGRPLHIDFHAGDRSGASYGCGANDCRHIRHIRIKP